MKENENKNEVVKTEEDAQVEKETFLQKAARKQTEARARRAAKKAAKAEAPKKSVKEWITEHKVVLGAGATVLVGTAIAIAKAKANGETGTIDPDWECEPGDDYPEFEDENSSEETTNEEVTEE